MNTYNENNFCNNIINKYKVLLPKKLSKSKSYFKNNDNSAIKYKNNYKSLYIIEPKKFIKFRNFSSKNKSKLFYLKNPSKSNFVQKILNEIIPKNIRKPYGIKFVIKLPEINSKTEPHKNIEKKKKNNKSKIVFKKTNFINLKVKNVTDKYIQKEKKKQLNIKYLNYHGKFVSNFLTPFNQFMSCNFNLTNNFFFSI